MSKPTPDEIRSLFDRRRAHAAAAQLAAVISQNATSIAGGGLNV